MPVAFELTISINNNNNNNSVTEEMNTVLYQKRNKFTSGQSGN